MIVTRGHNLEKPFSIDGDKHIIIFKRDGEYCLTQFVMQFNRGVLKRQLEPHM